MTNLNPLSKIHSRKLMPYPLSFQHIRTLTRQTNFQMCFTNNKANLRDLIAATGLVSNWIQIDDISAHMTVKFDGWPRKTIGHFCTTSSFVHHFKSIGEFKLELQSRNAQFLSKLAIIYPVWPWNLMDELENNRAPLLYHIKLCASFKAIGEVKLELQSGNAQFGSKSAIFCPVRLWN